MDRCTELQSQMLDYVYDLLDGDDRRQFADHLEQCKACQDALRAAQSDQHLFAAAARMEFPNVRFQVPVEEPTPSLRLVEPEKPAVAAADNGPAVLPIAPTVRRVRWQRWALAATVLLAVGVPTLFGLDYLGARRQVARSEERIAELHHQNEAATQALDK